MDEFIKSLPGPIHIIEEEKWGKYGNASCSLNDLIAKATNKQRVRYWESIILGLIASGIVADEYDVILFIKPDQQRSLPDDIYDRLRKGSYITQNILGMKTTIISSPIVNKSKMVLVDNGTRIRITSNAAS